MKRIHLVTLLATVLFTACAQQASQPSTEIPAASERWEQAFNEGDIEALLASYAEDCRVLPPNAELGNGHAAVTASFEPMIAAGTKMELETIESVAAGDIGYHVGTYTIMSADGTVTDRGKFVEVRRLINGEWKITNDIWNSDLGGAAAGTTTLVFTHEVNDAAHWLAAWQGPESRHQLFAQHGAPNVRVFQNTDNPNLVGLVADVSDVEGLQTFLNSPEADAAKAADGVKNATIMTFSEVK